jgi:hypothetical protein
VAKHHGIQSLEQRPTAKYTLRPKRKEEKIGREKLKLLYKSAESQVEGKEDTEGPVHQLHERSDDEIDNENNNTNSSKRERS